MPKLTVETPLGPVTVREENGAIVALDWGRGGTDETPLLRRARKQLKEFFAGRREGFDLPLAPRGTPFQRKVWQVLEAIPRGQTRGYGEIARQLGTAPRAVGGACGRNPIPILIPCHRVMAADRSLTGYSGRGGLRMKEALLAREGAQVGLFDHGEQAEIQ